MHLSNYSKRNADEIRDLFILVFTDSEGQSEGQLIGNLVGDIMNETDEKDLYGFLSIDGKRIVGSIFFSRVSFESGTNVFILSPVAVDTDRQGEGIGQKLITFGLKQLANAGVEVALTYGDPKFYSRVGFNSISEKLVTPPMKLSQPEGWLGQSLIGNSIEGIEGSSFCVKALAKAEYW